MSRRTSIFATLTDAGSSAAASFIAGLIALQTLSDSQLALYALLFSAGVAAMVVPQHFGYLPRRMHINRLSRIVRSNYISDLRRAAPYIVVAVAFVVVSGAPLLATLRSDSFIYLVSGAALWIFFSSFQDHVRTSLHVTQHHARAAVVSLCQLGVCSLGYIFVLLLASQMGPSLLVAFPFGLLALANAISASVGVLLHRLTPVIEVMPHISFTESVMTGTSGLLLQLYAYFSNLLVVLGLGTAALATLEGARIASQPVLIAGTALATFFIPVVIRLQHSGKRREAKRRIRVMMVIQFGAGFAYAAALPALSTVLATAAGRPIDAGLSAARAVASSAQAAVNPLNQLNVADRQYAMAIAATSASCAIGLGALALMLPTLGAYALPISAIVGAAVRWILIAFWPRRASAGPR